MKISKNFLAIVLGITVALFEINFVSCAESNCNDNSKLQYEAGKSYSYKVNLVTYDSENRGKFGHHLHTHRSPRHELRKTKGQITTEGKVVLTALENCEFVLTLSKVTQEVQGDREYTNVPITTRKVDVPRTSVKFTFKNGEVFGLRGASEDQRQPWSDNIVRGILTMIQNKAMSNADGEPEEKETNIKGDCTVKVYIPKDGLYQKKIHAGQCSDSIISPLAEGVPYISPIYSPIAGLRHLNSHIHCVQLVQDGVLANVNCTETDEVPLIHLRMDTVSTIQVESNEIGMEPEKVGGVTEAEILALEKSMSFVYDMTPNILGTEPKLFQDIANLAKTMYTSHDVNKAELYLKLKLMLTSVKNFEELEKTLEKNSEEGSLQIQFVKNIVREAATEVGSEAAVVYLAKLVDNNKLDWTSTMAFYDNLPYSRDPTVNGLGALLGNIEGALNQYKNDTLFSFQFEEKKKVRKMIIATSAYAYQFCRRHPECSGITEYQELVNQISQFCNSIQPEIYPACVQALGNVEHLPPKAVDAIKDILLSGGLLITGNTKKITAFDAFRRDPCQPELKTLAREILENTENPQDFRIVAYLATSRCLQEDDIQSIDVILQNEFDSPLSSFIASHVYNIMDSQSPSKSYLKLTALGQIGIPQNVPSVHNSSFSSRFVEFSTFHPESNIGWSIDGHMIFKDDGTHDPLFAHFNFTVDALGKSYNNFQIGLSKRFFPRIAKFNRFFNIRTFQWIGRTLMPAIFGMDSYIRVFGTTVSMGIDIFDKMGSPHQFFDRFEDKATGLLRLDMVRPFTILEKEIIFPTIGGIPITSSISTAYFPIILVNHTGDPNGLGLHDLFSKWDDKSGQFRHESRSDSTITAKVSVAAGKGTPVSMAYNFEVKSHFNHSISYESLKNLSTNWIKKIEFPDMMVWSKRITLARTFTMDHWTDQVTDWPAYGEMKDESSTNLFKFEAMGIKCSGEVLKHQSPLDTDVILKVEKTEDQFTGYSLDIETNQNGNVKLYDVKMSADGLSTEDTLHLSFTEDSLGVSELQSDEDKPKTEYTIKSEYTRKDIPASGLSLHYASQGFPKSELNLRSTISEYEVSSMLSLVSLGILTRSSYAVQLESWSGNDKVSLVDWTITSKKDICQATMKFGGSLKPTVGTISAQISTPTGTPSNELTLTSADEDPGITVNAEITHDSDEAGQNTITVDFLNANDDMELNTTVSVRGQSYHLSQRIPKNVLRETMDESGTHVLTRFESVSYNAHYHDTEKQDISVTAAFEQSFLPTSTLNNGSIRITGPKLPAPFVAETSLFQEVDRTLTKAHDGIQRWMVNMYFDAFGKHRAEFQHDHNFTETMFPADATDFYCQGHLIYSGRQGVPRCVTGTAATSLVISDLFEFSSDFTTDEKFKTNFAMRAYHLHPHHQSGGNLNFTSVTSQDHPGMWMNHKTTINLENVPKHGHNFTTTTTTEIDLMNRTLGMTSATTITDHKKHKDFSLKVDASWPQKLSDGDTTVKISHQCPKNTVTIDILNQARCCDEPEQAFNNKLTATWDVSGLTKIRHPKKQLTWVLTSSTYKPNPEDQTHEQKIQMSNDMKITILDDAKTNIFHLQGNDQVSKVRNQESWQIFGKGNVFLHGKEKTAWDYDAELNIAQTMNEVAPESGSTDVATVDGTKNSPSKTTFKWRGDGWFETETPEIRNNTWSSKYYSEAAICKMIKVEENFDFVFKKIDIPAGHVMFTIDVKGGKNATFEDLLHFSKHDQVIVKADNKTTIFTKDMVINGPHITFFLKSDSGQEDEDAYVIDFAGGIYEEKHQHKFNVRSGNKNHHWHRHHSRHHHHQHLRNGTGLDIPQTTAFRRPGHFIRNMIPIENFNFTISK